MTRASRRAVPGRRVAIAGLVLLTHLAAGMALAEVERVEAVGFSAVREGAGAGQIAPRDAAIRKVFYPVFPPDRNAADVMAWLKG